MKITLSTQLIAATLFALATVVMADEPTTSGLPIAFTLEKPSRVSLAVYDKDGVQLRSLLVGEWLKAGSHEVRWDGLDLDGRAVEPGKFEWKLVSSPGIEADYLGAIGANPKAGGWTKWVGNHHGPTTIAVGLQGICVAGPIAEGPPNIHMFEPDFSTSRWLSPHLGWSSIGTRSVAMTDKFVIGLGQDAQATVRDVKTGHIIKTFDVLWAGDKRPDYEGGQGFDIDALGEQCVVLHSEPRQQELFIDGQLIATNTGPGGSTGLTGTITPGRANTGGSFKDGSLDEFRIYSRRLTAEEISQLSKWRR